SYLVDVEPSDVPRGCVDLVVEGDAQGGEVVGAQVGEELDEVDETVLGDVGAHVLLQRLHQIAETPKQIDRVGLLDERAEHAALTVHSGELTGLRTDAGVRQCVEAVELLPTLLDAALAAGGV